MSIKQLIVLFIFVSTAASAQKKITIREFYDLLFADTTALDIPEDTELTSYDDFDVEAYLTEKGYSKDSAGKAIVKRAVSWQSAIKSSALHLVNLRFTKSIYIEIEGDMFINGCAFEHDAGFFSGAAEVKTGTSMFIGNNTFASTPTIYCQNGMLFIERNRMLPRDCPYGSDVQAILGLEPARFVMLVDTVKVHGLSPVMEDGYWNCIDCSDIYIRENQIELPSQRYLSIRAEAKKLYVTENSIDANVAISGSASELFIMENKFLKHISIEALAFGELSDIEWQTLGKRLAALAGGRHQVDSFPRSAIVETGFAETTDDNYVDLQILIDGDNAESLLDDYGYRDLLYLYKKMYDLYRTRGDVESANKCFVAIKDIEGNRLLALYNQDPSFKRFFSYGLNRLMKLYTNHATDPALALLLSFYIIFVFGIIYFFFPSEWDTNRKSDIIANFKDFARKNDKGYLRPFLRMCYLFLLSFFNALTLSLNSFVTLGFGNIPTKGFARYICVLQGFLGWFLLSIFTVALFNQVLF